MKDKSKGLVEKYRVYKSGQCPGLASCREPSHQWVPVEDRVFVLNPNTDPIALRTLSYYAAIADDGGYHQLAQELRDWALEIRTKQAQEAVDGGSDVR